ncbi:MAG: ABC transporter permease [Butyrivibrio sp.]|nr:ABC transporter permease [Butyrivibrio sp.]
MKLLYKHIRKDFFAKKTMVVILSLFVMFTSFLYFFVRFSVDKNLDIYRSLDKASLKSNELKYLTALESNVVLIRYMTFGMVLIFSLILFLYISNTMKKNRAKVGHIQSLGYEMGDIAKGYGFVTLIMALPSVIAGFVAGFFGSQILISAYHETYSVDGSLRGIHFSTFMKGTVLLAIFAAVVAYVACISFGNKDVALLIKNADSSDKKPGIVEKFIGLFKLKNGYKYKLTFKNISEILLLVTAIVTFSIMFVLSVSLILSSSEIMKSQRDGRAYAYETTYDECMEGESDTESEVHFLKFAATIDDKGKKIDYNIVGIVGDNKLLTLYDNKNKEINLSAEEGIVLNPELSENYGIKIGDELGVEIAGNVYTVKATAVARNAGVKTMYMSKEKLTELLGLNENSYNGVFSDKQVDGGETVAYEDVMEALSRDQTSNKTSAVINQSIGVITGCLLIFLAMFIGLSSNTESILIFDLLGYDSKKINRTLLDPYMVVSNIIFVITLPICVFAAKRIQISTSLATGDYMPFQLSVFTVVYMFVILNLLCFLVRAVFTLKIKKIMSGEKQSEYLYEW